MRPSRSSTRPAIPAFPDPYGPSTFGDLRERSRNPERHNVPLSSDPVEWSRFRLRDGSTEDASIPRKAPTTSLLRLPKLTCFVIRLGLSDLSLVTLIDPVHLLLRVGPATAARVIRTTHHTKRSVQ
jgi:hypothetical protein